MKAIDYVVRSNSGALQRGDVLENSQASVIRATGGQEISLNLRPSDMQGYARNGNALNIVLADGRVIIIEDYFGANGRPNQLFISADGDLTEVVFIEESDGTLQAQFGPTQEWSKWSPDDDLIHLGRAEMGDALVAEPEDTTMLAGMGGNRFAAGGLLAALGLAAAAAAASNSGDDDSDNGGTDDTSNNVTIGTIEGDNVINDAERADGVIVTGTTDPGSTVEVTLGTATVTATVDENGNWTADFPASVVPEGEYETTATAVSTDANGNTATADQTVQVDTSNHVTIGTIEGDNVINEAERADGVIVTGTTDPGSAVEVTLGTATVTATVDANGNWTANFPASVVPEGEYDTTATAVSTDANGNTATATQAVHVDTVAGILTISPEPVETDDIVNFAEREDNNVLIDGTATPGATVLVTLQSATMGTVTKTVTTNSNGIWEAVYNKSDIPDGTYDVDITATTTDSAGNTLTATDTVRVDTHVDNLSVNTSAVGGDNTVNAVEAASGVVINGTTEVGSSATVTMNGHTVQAVVDANGNWTASFAANQIPSGESIQNVTVNATDLAGNTDSKTGTVRIDTIVDPLTVTNNGAEGGDNTINAAEASDGIQLNGRVEIGSSVIVNFQGTNHTATVDAAGNWSVAVPASAIPHGTYDANITVTATDLAGNVRSVSPDSTLHVDTEAPGVPIISSYERSVSGLIGFKTAATSDDLEVYQITQNGAVSNVQATQTNAANNQTEFNFTNTVPDGSSLIVRSTDTAGNSSATYTVYDDEATGASVNMGVTSLGTYNIETLDLQYAEEAQVTLTEAQVIALSSNTDTLTIRGGSDDDVIIRGAVRTGSHQQDGESYTDYTLGDATVRVDDDIPVVI